VSFWFRAILGSGVTVTTARRLPAEGGDGAGALAFHVAQRVALESRGEGVRAVSAGQSDKMVAHPNDRTG